MLGRQGGDRRFGAILGLSLLLHVALFAVISAPDKDVPVKLPPLIASLHPLSIPAPSQVVEAAATPAATVTPKLRQAATRAESRPVPLLTQTARPTKEAANVSAPSSRAVESSESAVAAAPSPVAASEAVPAAQPVAAGRPQSELLDGYRQRLGELFARQQEYPRIAAMRGWEGEVRLRLKVARKGNLVAVNLDRSSGFEVLDQHALAMVERLASLPPLPEALEANEIQVVVPINYKLKKTT